MGASLQRLTAAIINGDRNTSAEATQHALEHGTDALDILETAASKAMVEVGRLYQEGEYFIPEMLMSAKAFESVMKILEPHILKMESETKGKIVIATCKGDIHSLGKNLVASMLGSAGFVVNDLGEDVPTETILDTAEQENADIIAVSALMTTSMGVMKEIVDGAKERGLRTKILVGGGPVTKEYADKIGADGFGSDATDAVSSAIKLMG